MSKPHWWTVLAIGFAIPMAFGLSFDLARFIQGMQTKARLKKMKEKL